MMLHNNEPEFIFFDLFCGAGGVSSGLLKAKYLGEQLVKIAGCINHDPFAILSHAYNHKRVKHFIEDIRTFDVRKFADLAKAMRKRYPNAKICIWASLECTNYSKAKGGKSRDADSRTLAMYLPRYITAVNPDYVFIENVIEFMQGCELIPKEIWHDKNGRKLAQTAPKDYHYDLDLLDWYYAKKLADGQVGECPIEIKKPNKKKKNKIDKPGVYPVWYPNPNKIGEDYEEWVRTVKSMGYDYAWKDMNAADYGCHTSRSRYFGLFAKPGLPLFFPEATHDKRGANGKPKWLPVKEVLDFSDKGDDIMPEVRNTIKGKKALEAQTYRRVFEGCVKHIANGDRSFLTVEYSSHNNTKIHPGQSVNKTSHTVTCQHRSRLVQCEPVSYLVKYNSTNGVTGKSLGASVNEPSPVIGTQRTPQLVQVEPIGFVAKYHSKGDNTYNFENPSPVVATNDGMSLYQADYFMHNYYNNGGESTSINSPANTVMGNPKSSLVTCERGEQHYIIMPQYGDHCSHSIEKPAMTLIARMDKTVPYLVTLEDGRVAIKINKNDLPEVKNIKKFMAAYGIARIRMRMLKETELLQIQEFPKDYKLFGDSAARKKFIGNAVPTLLPMQWVQQMGMQFKQNSSIMETILMLDTKVA